jgi:hypothetical protein
MTDLQIGQKLCLTNPAGTIVTISARMDGEPVEFTQFDEHFAIRGAYDKICYKVTAHVASAIDVELIMYIKADNNTCKLNSTYSVHDSINIFPYRFIQFTHKNLTICHITFKFTGVTGRWTLSDRAGYDNNFVAVDDQSAEILIKSFSTFNLEHEGLLHALVLDGKTYYKNFNFDNIVDPAAVSERLAAAISEKVLQKIIPTRVTTMTNVDKYRIQYQQLQNDEIFAEASRMLLVILTTDTSYMKHIYEELCSQSIPQKTFDGPCVICLDNGSDITLPCGHKCMHTSCVVKTFLSRLGICPCCRAAIT